MKQLFKLLFVLTFYSNAIGQVIYQHAFGTSTFSAVNPYTVTPNAIDVNLNSSQWQTSYAPGYSSVAGATGLALNITNSGGTPTYSLSFNVAAGFNCDISAFSFWRQRSAAGAQNWTLTVNGVTQIGVGTVPTVGVNTGTVSVASAANNLSGNVIVVLKLGGATSTGSFRLDDFILYGSVYPISGCSTPTLQASAFGTSGVGNNSGVVSWVPGSGGNVIVVAHQGSPVVVIPTAGNNYTANSGFALGQQIGAGNYVVYNGSGTFVNVTGLNAATNYYFAVFEYTVNAGSPCYLTPAETGSLTTTGTSYGLQMRSILADACNGAGVGVSVSEPYNEMIFFKTGSGSIPISQISIAGRGGTGTFQANKWPNAAQIWHGLVQNANTAAKTASLNSTIIGCGFIREPVSGIIPANSDVIMVTSQYLNTTYNSFTNLNDSIYIVYQDTVSDAVQGHFLNWNATSTTRGLIIFDNANNYSDTVFYDANLLINQNGLYGGTTAIQNGATIEYNTAGNATYVNRGCQAPYIPLSVDATFVTNNVICKNTTAAVTATTSGTFNSVTWSGGAGSYLNNSVLTTTYTPGATETGTVMLYCNITNSCPPNFITTKDSMILTINDFSQPVVASTTPTLCTANVATLSYSLTNNALVGTHTQTWLPSNNTALTQTVNTAGIYTVSVNNVCGTVSNTIQITSIPNVSVSIAATTSSACAPNSITLTATSNVNTYTWSTASNTNVAVTNTLDVSASGTYSVKSSNACNTDVAMQVITIVPLPTVSVSQSSVGVCNGNSALITASANTAVTYTWASSSNTNIATTNTISLSASGIYTVTASNECASSSKTVEVVAGASPAISISSTSTNICPATTATLMLSGSTGTVTWSGSLGSATTATINSAGNYSVSLTNSCGTGTANITIGSTLKPTVTANATATLLCDGATTTITANSNINDYNWSNGLGTASTVTVNTAGTYTVYSTNQCGKDSAQVTISTNTTPNFTITASSTTLCAGSSATLSIPTTTNAILWSVTNQTLATIIVLPTITTVYTVTVSNNCGNFSQSHTINVTQIPIIAVTPTVANICPGSSITLMATSNETVSPYEWNNSTGTLASVTNTLSVNVTDVYSVSITNACGIATAASSISVGGIITLAASASPSTLICNGVSVLVTASGATSNLFNWTNGTTSFNTVVDNAPFTSAGNYTVTSTTGCGTVAATFTLGADATPTINVIPTTTLLCNGSSVNLIASSTSTNNTYSWFNFANTTATLSNVTVAGNYTVTSTNGCGTGTASALVTTGATPTISIAAPSVTMCNNAGIVLTATSTANVYNWNPNSVITNTTLAMFAGDYVITSTNGCGIDSKTITVVNENSPVLTVNTTNTTVCNGTTALLTATSSVNSYTWANTSNFTPTLVVTTSGIYTIQSQNSCGLSTKTITVNFQTTPTLNISASSQTICPGSLATLTVVGGTGPYNWSNTTNTGSVITTDANTIIVTQANGSCPVSVTQIVISNANIASNFSLTPNTGLNPLDVNFTNLSTGATSYTWNYGNTNTATTFTAAQQTYTAVGVYTISLTVSNGVCNSVVSTQTLLVTEPEPDLVVPNVFTPNGDNVNEIFKVTPIKTKDFKCVIYNRWGAQLFAFSDIKAGWDGKTGGNDVPDGIYFYLITATDINDVKIEKQGSFLLAR